MDKSCHDDMIVCNVKKSYDEGTILIER